MVNDRRRLFEQIDILAKVQRPDAGEAALVREGGCHPIDLMRLASDEDPPLFAPLRARVWPAGELLLWDELEWEGEAEEAARSALEEGRGLGDVKGASANLRTAFAIALALHDPELEVVGLIASAGNIHAEQATQNVHLLINAIDPPKWPRLGAALPVVYEIDGTRLHGADGLGNIGLPPVTLHQPTPGD